MSGTGHATRTVAAQGNQGIDGLLTPVVWGTATIDYSFPTVRSVYGYSVLTGLPAGVFGATAAQKTAVQFALDADPGGRPGAAAGFAVEGFTGLGVQLDTTPDADQIRLANTTAASLGTARVADFPGNYDTTPVKDNGDVWFGTAYAGTVNDYTTPAAGNYAWLTHIHEIGHALGLKHGQEDVFEGPMPAAVDSMEFTVMTYRSYVGDPLVDGYSNEQWGYAQSYMMYDIAALQHMYGADFSTSAGDTVYRWTPGSGDTLVDGGVAIAPGGNRIFATIWDGGGTDTYDLSGYTTNLSLDLAPGGHSVFSDVQRAALGDGNLARGNVFNALQYRGDARSLIENATGGAGDDRITGNAAGNLLRGNDGADTLLGGAGNDTLEGTAGNDVIAGGGGRDTGRGGTGSDTLQGGAGKDVLIGAAGNDRFDFDFVSNSAPGANCDVLQAGSGAPAFAGAGGAAGDLFDLFDIDANTTVAGNQAFVFNGAGPGRLWCVNSGTTTRVYASVDGDAAAEVQINILDAGVQAAAYSAADFIL